MVQYGNYLGGRNVWLSDNPVEVSKEHLSLLVGRYVQTKVICVRNKDKPWFDDQCRHAFGLQQEAHLRWTRDCCRVNREEFVHCLVRANETYSESKRQFSDIDRDVLMNIQSPHKWWSTRKSAVFGCSAWCSAWCSAGCHVLVINCMYCVWLPCARYQLHVLCLVAM